MNQIDWNEYDRTVREMVAAGVNEGLAKDLAYEKLKTQKVEEVYSPFETINS